MHRLAVALHLAGDYNASDAACQRFRELYPQSSLTPAVLFCAADNAYFRALAAERNPNVAEREKQVPALFDEAARRFGEVVAKYPEYPKINLARFSLGLAYYRKGDLDKARRALSEIPGPERVGEVGQASYLIADCILRQVPATVPEDALAAGKMEEQLKSSADLLAAFVAANPHDYQTADALHQARAVLPAARGSGVAAARAGEDSASGAGDVRAAVRSRNSGASRTWRRRCSSGPR